MAGCFGRVDGWFISRQRMPVICEALKCLSFMECYQASFEAHTGLTGVEAHYQTEGFGKYRTVKT